MTPDDFIDLDDEEQEAEAHDAMRREERKKELAEKGEDPERPKKIKKLKPGEKERFSTVERRLFASGTSGPAPAMSADSFEEAAPSVDVSIYTNKIEELELSIHELQKTVEEKEEKFREIVEAHQEHKKDTEKFRERTERNIETQVDAAKHGFLTEFLGLLDNFEIALDAFEKNPEPEPLAEGVRMIQTQAEAILSALGVTSFSPDGDPFDPNDAEAFEVVTVEDEEEHNKVLETLRPGYRFKGKLLRPARVRVGQKQG